MSRHVPTPDRPSAFDSAALAALSVALRELDDMHLGIELACSAMQRDDAAQLGKTATAAWQAALVALLAGEQRRRRRLMQQAERDLLADRVTAWWGDRELP